MSVVHLHGPRSLTLSQDEAIVTCVVRNGEYYMASFLEHYLGLGFRHVFILDNGSEDDTLAIAQRYKGVSLLRSTLPITTNQRFLKRYLATHAKRSGWCLDADIDEFFDYPFSESLSLRDFLRYLNERNYSAVMTQLLDMFSRKPLSFLASNARGCFEDTYPYYDLSDATTSDYTSSTLALKYAPNNTLADRRASLCWGGIRKTLYGNNCLLTKHSLFRPSAGVEPFTHVHFVNNARMADVSGVMLHYKLTSNAIQMTRQNQANFPHNSDAYKAFLEVLTSESERDLVRDSTRRYTGAAELTHCGFLFASPRYKSFVDAAQIGLPSPQLMRGDGAVL